MKSKGIFKQSVSEGMKSITKKTVTEKEFLRISADKINNLYYLSMEWHSKLPTENNSNSYKQKKKL